MINNIKKKFCFSIVILFIVFAQQITSSDVYSQQYWLKQYTPTHKFLRMCYFLDSLRGWVAGDSALVMKTTNGGYNWTIQNPNVTDNIHYIFFLNERLGWALSWIINKDKYPYGTNISRTTNGGTNWIVNQFPINDIFIYCVTFLDSLNGWLGGYPGPFYKTTNGGANWMLVLADTSVTSTFPVREIKFYNRQIAYASGGFMDLAGAMWKTTNGGTNWKAENVSPEPLNAIALMDSSTLYAVGGDFEYGSGIVKTTNGGTNWNYMTLDIFGIATSISFRTKAEGWGAIGWGAKIISTFDSAKSWDIMSPPDSNCIFYMQFTDKRNGYAVGDSGLFYRYNKNLIGVRKLESKIPENFRLEQNYPNPFNPITKVKFNIGQEVRSQKSEVRIIVYDILGKEIQTLVNDKFEPGIYEVDFDGSNLSSGIYFYQLTAGDFRQVRKMVLLK